MNPEAIFWPMIVLAALTCFVSGLVPISRFRAGFAGKVGPKDFRAGESARVPEPVAIPNRNYMNLLEISVLFYVACLSFNATRHVLPVDVSIALAFVALRIVHSSIHLTYNNAYHRGMVFGLSVNALLALWVRFAISLL